MNPATPASSTISSTSSPVGPDGRPSRRRPRRRASVVVAVVLLVVAVIVVTGLCSARVSAQPTPHGPAATPAPAPVAVAGRAAVPRAPGTPIPRPSAQQSGHRRARPSPRSTSGPVQPRPPGGDHWYNPLSWFWRGLKWLDASLIQYAVWGMKHTILSTPDVTAEGRVRDLWGACASAANALLVLGVIAAALVMMTHESLQIRYGVKDLLARIVWGGVSANCSLLLCGYAIRLANAITGSLSAGLSPERVASTLLPYDVPSGGLVVVLLYSTVGMLMVLVTLTWVARSALILLAVIAAPLALVCHAVPKIEEIAVLWWRGFAALLLAQLGQALVLIAAVRVFFTSDGRAAVGLSTGGQLVNAELAICLAYLLIRIPGWCRKAVFRGHGPSLTGIVRLAVVQQVLRRTGTQVLAGHRTRSPGPRGGRGGQGGRGS